MKAKATLVALASAALLTAAAQPAQAQAGSGFFMIQNFASARCLQPESNSPNDVVIVQRNCNRNDPLQHWVIINLGDNRRQFLNRATSRCMETRTGARNGDRIDQWTCNNISNERWIWKPNSAGFASSIKSNVSGTSSHCLDVPGGQSTDGLAMQLYACNSTTAQAFYVFEI
ncbi:RICIN domain-containing protein [Nonomuraea endophytica]|uniref:RICIN domain-containing protein n=1 Tax=Nonomuraea endophytica TaxID=714136 RepID=UPI0037C83F1C